MTLNFAHRGSMTEAPENTVPSFKKAIAHGTRAIELDVQLTKDHHLVVCHDHKLTKYNSSANQRIIDLTLEELKQIDIGSSFNGNYTGITIPTLDEVLNHCPRDIFLNIEIKNIPVIYNGIEERLIRCLSHHNRFDNVLISSFDHLALKKIQEMVPNIPLGMLFYYRILNPWDYASQSGLTITSIHPNNVYTDKSFIENCHNRGYKVYPYTVNHKERYRELVNYGVDGVFSNNPEIFSI
ncbi:MAG: glycerophosphodiester phosphodiesterase [Bacillota bacterium]|uniref:glycerophosphodiester phosphodiesterase n=1 Tax=unclassified Virgibacillus TaxID=2620237 RepID=UPI000EF4F588|nr:MULTISPECIES: glycerophosphodiester phosphodiesterase family protein [unclassified Virgibacillus]MCC2248681.1 glycerophosphodiester phosphodiesterase [Virgibacillus sp. AGTR]MDY7044973.1 glycerophosphodiester phosphodiesterase family protein [Virgibacillus sp. M23]QRZ18437.1 glycerophosphodiester phosphodiesterase [Virgibacillus sp. AGTR]